MNFKDKIAELISQKLNLPVSEILPLIVVPPKEMGDFAFPCFIAAKTQKKNPLAISSELAGTISADFIKKVEAKGPYLNFFLNNSTLSSSVLELVFNDNYCSFPKNQGKVMVEYSSPNTNKPLHVGHLRNNTLGLAISNLLELTGHKVIKANLINDRGVHICKSMLAYQLFGKGKDPKKLKIKSDHFVGDMYVLYNKKLAEDTNLEEKNKELLLKWEKGDKKTIALWKKMNKWAISGMKETYKDFGTKFDTIFLESEMFKKQKGKQIIEEGLKKGLFKKEENGAIVAVLEPKLPNKVLLRGDGTSLYATNDLGTTQEKFDEFKLDKSIWVVANEQDLYFKQLFEIFNKLGREWANKCYHLSYGMVALPSGRMKSREGTTADADDLLAEVKKIALDEIKKRYPTLKQNDAKERAHAIALGGIKFFLLKNDAKKEMIFNPKESLSFDGETGPYLQYTFARAKSILRKAKEEGKKYSHKNFDLLEHEKEKALIVEISKFKESILRSWDDLSLHPLCHNLLSIAEKFNSYYHEVPILKSESKELLSARLSLVEATTIILKKGMNVLDIEAIDEM